jgi:hemerythrin-like domain-containing protein
VLLILFAGLFISACTVKNTYKQLDWILAGMVEDYVTPSETQETEIDARIAALLKWHQFTQLNRYVADLKQLQQYTSRGFDAQSVDDMFQRFMRSWQAIKQRIAPEMADMFLTLSATQQTQLFENLSEKNQELDEDFKEYTQQQRYQRAGEKLIEKVEDWLGELTDEQKAMLRSWPPKFKSLHAERMAFRVKWQAALKALLQKPMPADEKRQLLIDLIESPEVYRSAEHKQNLADNIELAKRLILEFDKTLSKPQRDFLIERIDQLIATFEELAAEKT